MKILFSLTLLVLPYLGTSQGSFSFPDELKVDPYDVELRILNVQRIEQVHTSIINDNQDSSRIDANSIFQYIVEYDTLNRISSFKYDFQKEYGQSLMSGPDGPVTIYGYNDTSRLEPLSRYNDTIYFNYYENQFRYNEFNALENIKIIRPYRGGILDGVYIKEPDQEKIIEERTYENNLLKQVTVRSDGVHLYTETYSYSTFKKDDLAFSLLTKITRVAAGRKDVYDLNYLLYD